MAIASLELSGMLRVKPHMIFRLIHQSLTVLGVSLNFVSDEGEIVSIFSFDICDMTEVGKSKSLSGPKKGVGLARLYIIPYNGVLHNEITWLVVLSPLRYTDG